MRVSPVPVTCQVTQHSSRGGRNVIWNQSWLTDSDTYFFLFIGLWVSHYGACFSAVWVPTWRGPPCLPYVLLITCGQSRIKAVWETHHIGIHCHPSAQEGWGRRRVSLMPAWTTKKKKKLHLQRVLFPLTSWLYWSSVAWLGTLRWLPLLKRDLKLKFWPEKKRGLGALDSCDLRYVKLTT